jgi:hypothetical protein
MSGGPVLHCVGDDVTVVGVSTAYFTKTEQRSVVIDGKTYVATLTTNRGGGVFITNILHYVDKAMNRD